ncbi:hypothetical protein MNEG_15511 [Monoraphidium neglectum]|uniref:Uncharacterized protein n=1 Tax=Monoraphidium neglectum TaxID=145388 RepID=A0A0D2LR95_9CHLO|nr:hypothetical protein MNEG_15511 [Monoraphidium neglectum]KIY92451.1 hypothetical protein MNEG_15511 [Monoraphidium neglectum]|eukprot:XP_013891471.1 hypothetical protein MNEG_15511 [Monoraphidium neglectum]
MFVLADLLRRPDTAPLAAAALSDGAPGSRPCGMNSTAVDLLLAMVAGGGRLGRTLPAAASVYYGLRTEPLRGALMANPNLLDALHTSIIPGYTTSCFSAATLAELLRPEPEGERAAAVVRLFTTPDPRVSRERDPLRFHALGHLLWQLNDFVDKGDEPDRAMGWPQTHFATRGHHVRRAAVELLPMIVRAAGPEQRRTIVREGGPFLPMSCRACADRLQAAGDEGGRAAAAELLAAARLLRDAAAEGGDAAGAESFDIAV